MTHGKHPMRIFIIEHRTRGVFLGWRDEPGLFPRFSYTSTRDKGSTFFSLKEAIKAFKKCLPNVRRAEENMYIIELEMHPELKLIKVYNFHDFLNDI